MLAGFQFLAYGLVMEAQIAALSPEVLDRLRQAFEAEFPIVRPMPMGLLIGNQEQGRSILIAPDRLQVRTEGPGVEPDFASHQQVLERLLEVFELGSQARLGFQLLGACRVQGDAREISLAEFTSVSREALSQLFPEARAVGLRFSVSTEEGVDGELQVTPSAPDALAIAFEGLTRNPWPVSEAVTFGQAALARFQQWVSFVQTTFAGDIDEA